MDGYHKRMLSALALLVSALTLESSAAPLKAVDVGRISAVMANSASCKALGSFALELGDAKAANLKLNSNSRAPKETQPLQIASSTKWLAAAYFIERSGLPLSASTREGLRMLTGRVSFEGCGKEPTVESCYQLRKNPFITSAEVGFFNYGSAHYASLAMDFGLGKKDIKTLGAELQKVLGISEIEFFAPNLAAGAVVTPRAFTQFLRKILSGKLKISSQLGVDTVCTLPGECTLAHSTPVGRNFSYSYGHWVERTPNGSGDGVYSSVGMWGFYPWIDPIKKTYGLISLQSTNPQAYFLSLQCGVDIRKTL